MKKNLLIIPLLFLTVIVFGTNLSAQQGETCGAPLIVAALPFNDTGNTSAYGDNYGTTDVPPLAANAVTDGTGSADRKSTRLNSSHVRISYAVFCLKKK